MADIDPDVTLRALREAIETYWDAPAGAAEAAAARQALRKAEVLDRWLSKGGRLPEPWNAAVRRSEEAPNA